MRTDHLKWEPSNVTERELLDFLAEAKPAVVVLEPGDMTRYMLLLTPVDRKGIRECLGSIGIPRDVAGRYLHVTKLASDPRGQGWAWVPWIDGVEIEVRDVAEIHANQWTQQVFAWWLTELRRRVSRAERYEREGRS